MPPRKRKAEEEDEHTDEEELSLEDEEASSADDVSEDEQPKQKKAAPKKAAPTAKKAKGSAAKADHGEAKTPAGGSSAASEWQEVPPSVLTRDYGTKPSAKIAAFDLDGTLVNAKSQARFPKGPEDWRWFNKKTREKLLSYHNDGYKLVIFTNQGSIKSKLNGKAAQNVMKRIDLVVADLGVPVHVFAACQEDHNRKPHTGMWEKLCASNGEVEPDKSESFFVGDAAGRPGDFADTDKRFAEAVGIQFRLPEEEFGEPMGKKALPPGVTKVAEDGEGHTNHNPELTQLFLALADKYYEEIWKAKTAKTVAGIVSNYPVKITLENHKEVGKMKGVGKASLKQIHDFLTTGTFADLGDMGPVGKEAKEVKDKNADVADAFM